MRLGLRTLPPIGGRIAQRAVLGSLRDAFRKDGESQGLSRLMTQLTGFRHCILTDSGRSALSVIFMSLGSLRQGRDEVIIPAYTSYSVPAAVVRAGFRVRLCDVEIETLGLSPKELERVITPRTLCVVPNHLYGIPCQIKAVCAVAQDYGIPVVEDAAQAMEFICKDHPGDKSVDATMYSFSRGKTIPGAGGGLIGTNDDALAAQCRRIMIGKLSEDPHSSRLGLQHAIETAFMSIFIRPSLYWLPDSLPFLKLGASIYDPTFPIEPMSRFQEALAVRLLSGLEELQDVRKANAVRLGLALAELKSVCAICPRESEACAPLRLPVLIQDQSMRNKVLTELQIRGLGVTGGYPSPLSEIPGLKPSLADSDGDFPIAKQISRHLVTLPTHPWVNDRDIKQIVEVFQRWVR